MTDTLLFDCWNTLVQAPKLMRRGASVEIFHKSLTGAGVEVGFEDFRDAYVPIARRQLEEADRDGYRELDYPQRLVWVLESLGVDGGIRRRLAERTWRDYLAEWPRQTELYAETPSVLEALRGRYKLGLVTNYMDGSTARLVFDKMGFDDVFDSIVVSHEVGYRKPSRTIFERALAELGSKPETSVMVGDSFEADILGALRMGMRGVLIDPEGSQSKNHHLAHAVIRSIGEFKGVIKNL